MHGFAEKKVPGGKLLKVKIAGQTRIVSAQVLGDFFLHPEEKITELEQAIIGTEIPVDRKMLAEKLEKTVEHNGIELVGISPKDIAETVAEAAQNAR